MIDHLLGRPSIQFRKIQVLTVLFFWSAYLLRGNPHGPPVPLLRRLSAVFSRRFTAFQTVTLTLLYLYLARNFSKLLDLESPEPLANLYTRSYFRATWVMTAMDAGFWTAMRIRRKWMRDLCSILFTGYYLLAAERADEKVRRVRATITVDHLRISWNKPTTPYLKFFASLLHPQPNKYAPRKLRIPRPKESVYKTPVDAWLYFEGSLEALKSSTKVVLDFPGGGFVAMSPRHHDDKLLAWSRLCPGIPVIALDYKKAPEYPYPYALNECYDTYHAIVHSKGRVVGLSGDVVPKIALTGDSAGGNFAAGVTLMILNANTTSKTGHLEPGLLGLPLPDGLILIYPSLDLNLGCWMSDEQMSLIRQRDNMAKGFVRRKSEYYEKVSGHPYSTRHTSPGHEDEMDTTLPRTTNTTECNVVGKAAAILPSGGNKGITTRLAMTSRISYFNDRILTPEMMRAMVILYVGPDHRPDFTTDYFLSPLVAPDSLLANFPKTYFLTGERDPLVDDTVIFAGRIRAAKQAVARHRAEMGLDVHEDDEVEVSLITGISHGFLQMTPLFPAAFKEIARCACWLREILSDREVKNEEEEMGGGGRSGYTSGEDGPLEIGGGVGRGRGKGRRGRRRGSAISLGSEEDLVGRRMKGFTGGLTWSGDEVGHAGDR